MQFPPKLLSALRFSIDRALLPLVLCLPAFAGDEHPAIFQDLGFDAAQRAAQDKGGVMILDAMTSWCGPCKQMDRTTWIDPRLVEWVDANAVAIQLDMDEHTALKERLEIRAFPTIVMFRDGEEFDRVVGLRSADEMLAWLGAATEGKRAKDTVLERLGVLRAGAAEETWGERAALVSDLMWFKEYDEALVEHLWIWRNMPEGADGRHRSYRWGTQRFSMGELSAASPAAKEALRSLRDELTASVTSGAADASTLRDWIELNTVIRDTQATIRWARNASETPEGLRSLRALDLRLFDMLIDAGEWRVAGLGLESPVERTRRQRDDLGAYDDDAPSSGGMMPAIPMGGMQPAKPALPIDASASTADGTADSAAGTTEDADEPKSVPMIPMTAKRKSVPMIPMTAKRAGSSSVPMIPMGAGGATAPAEETVAQTVRRLLTEEFRKQSARRYGALLAAERGDEASEIAEIVLGELDDVRARGALLSAALRADSMQSAHERHLLWLDQIAR